MGPGKSSNTPGGQASAAARREREHSSCLPGRSPRRLALPRLVQTGTGRSLKRMFTLEAGRCWPGRQGQPRRGFQNRSGTDCVQLYLPPLQPQEAEGTGVSGEEVKICCMGSPTFYGLKGRNKTSSLEKVVWCLPFKKTSHIFYLCLLRDSDLRNWVDLICISIWDYLCKVFGAHSTGVTSMVASI